MFICLATRKKWCISEKKRIEWTWAMKLVWPCVSNLCATVLKKSAACLIAAIMNGVNFYRKSDSLRQKQKSMRKGSAAWKNRNDVNIDAAESAGKIDQSSFSFEYCCYHTKFRFFCSVWNERVTLQPANILILRQTLNKKQGIIVQ